ncbi:MAG: YncE family protein, partial [Bacteroidales bacterium]|nr:YncE family protein [Bacteroidales bacterium]
TLDFFRFSEGNYISDAFGSMNPTVVQGLGDTGNDLALHEGKLWIVMNGTGAVHVVDARDETLIGTIDVPDPRYVTFDNSYAYVSSYAGAIYGGEETTGKVFRISLATLRIDGSVEVGCQPEGLAVVGKKLYVANSGGYNYIHDNTVSVIDLDSFKASSQITVASNLHFLCADPNGKVWVSSYGESTWSQDEGGNWISNMSEPMGLYKVDPSSGSAIMVDGVHVSCMSLCSDGYIYAIGNASEMSGGYDNTLYKVSVRDGSVTSKPLSGTDLSKVGNPYGILANPENGDIYVADADYTGPGKVLCFTRDFKLKWSAVAGMLPAHMVLY